MEAKFTIGTMPVSEAKPILEKIKDRIGINYQNGVELGVSIVCANDLLAIAKSPERLLNDFDTVLKKHTELCNI